MRSGVFILALIEGKKPSPWCFRLIRRCLCGCSSIARAIFQPRASATQHLLVLYSALVGVPHRGVAQGASWGTFVHPWPTQQHNSCGYTLARAEEALFETLEVPSFQFPPAGHHLCCPTPGLALTCSFTDHALSSDLLRVKWEYFLQGRPEADEPWVSLCGLKMEGKKKIRCTDLVCLLCKSQKCLHLCCRLWKIRSVTSRLVPAD